MKVFFSTLVATLLISLAHSQPNVYPANGKVGIGTSSPEAQLTIDPPANNDGSFLRMGELVGSQQRYFNFGSSSSYVNFTMYGQNSTLRHYFQTNSVRTFFASHDPNGTEFFKVNSSSDEAFMHLAKENSKMVIGGYASYLDSEGYKFIVKDGKALIEGNIITDSRIGIGTDLFFDGLTNYRLSVNGKIRATGIKVYNTWADFVFEDTYKLPTLAEVEQYIETNGHLKDIPSAQEVEVNGIDLGEMNKLLLQKIEELTLYVIELNKEIEALKQKR